VKVFFADRLDVMAELMSLCLKACLEYPETDFTFGPQDPVQAYRSGFWIEDGPEELLKSLAEISGVTD
jgi:hypothetical protein